MSRIQNTTTPDGTRGSWLLVADPTQAGSSAHTFAAMPVADTVIGVLDTQGGAPFNLNPRALAIPTIKYADGAAAFDHELAVWGSDTLPTAGVTAAHYRAASQVVFPAKRLTQACITEGAAWEPRLPLFRYLFYVVPPKAAGVAPGVVVTLGLKVYNILDNLARS